MSSSTNIHDLTEIDNLTEETLVATIRERFLQDRIYTRLRSSTLVFVNPFKSLLGSSNFYETSEKYLAEYKETDNFDTWQQLDPHLFQHINHAYFHLRRTGHDQSIIFRGPSGSGKSEMRQAALQHLMTLSSGNSKKIAKTQQLVEQAHRVIEVFGHCKISGNNNASRFGSYVELQFNERGRMMGAKFLDYLLERSRVTCQPAAGSSMVDETNFHVFYYLLQDSSLQLQDGSSFRYLYNSREAVAVRADSDENTGLLELKTNLRALGVSKKTWQEMLHLLAGIVHLGNVQFTQEREQDMVTVKNPQVLENAAQFLGLDTKALENVLLYRTKLIKRDMTTMFVNAEQAAAQRDELARTLYSLLFTWIIEAINRKLCKSDFQNFIGIVDFPGGIQNSSSGGVALHAFNVQMANEKMHEFMIRHQTEYNVEVYREEAIDRNPVAIENKSAACVELLTDSALTQRQEDQQQQDSSSSSSSSMNAIKDFVTRHKQHPCLSVKRHDTFTVQHFSGPVHYRRSDLATENNEALNADFVALFRGGSGGDFYNCTNALARQLFDQETVNTESHPKGPAIVSAQQSSKPRRSPSMRKKNNQKNQHTTGSSRIGQLNDALNELTATLSQTQIWWVLCLRPNDLHLPSSCDARKLLAQIQAFQLLPLAQRAQHEYTMKMDTSQFCERYADIIQSINDDPDAELREKCEAVLEAYDWDEKMMVIGEEQVYLHNDAWMVLENRLRSNEKKEQRKARNAAKGIPDDDDDEMMDSQVRGAGGASVFSDEHYGDTGSVFTSSQTCETASVTKTATEVECVEDTKGSKKRDKTRKRVSAARGFWVAVTWMCTWWIPNAVLGKLGGMRRADIRMAWREKLTLCILIFILCAAMIWFICFFGQLLCPHQDLYTQSELQARSSKDNAYVSIRGEVFDLTSFAPRHWASEVIPPGALFQYAGEDVSDLFPVQVSALCDGNNAPVPDELMLETRINITDSNAVYHDFRYFRDDYRPDWYFEQMMYLRKNYRLGFMGYDPVDIQNQAEFPVQVGGISTQRRWAILHGNVYDLTSYLMGGVSMRGPQDPTFIPLSDTNITVGVDFIDNSITELFRLLAGTDISAHFDALPLDPDKRARQLTCLRNLFFVGKVDNRNSPQCLFSEYFLLLITVFLCSVILFKFLAALCLTETKRPMQEYDKFIVCQVPCYTEGEESLRKTIDSVAMLKYDDKRKLLFLVADGVIVGSGNDRSTPRIVLDILGVDPSVDPEPVSFLSLGQGQKQHNMAKVYSGLYECAGHVVPYIVVVKVGTPAERTKSGNRGKRDSQMVLMRFLNKVHYDAPMTPLELEIYHELKNVIGVHPSFYEYVLMIDADTEVKPDSLNRMVAHFVDDPKIIGLCGETMLVNEKDTWVTMIQVYEYYISHYLAKAFESLFGSVTCLPGCFCMYRIRSTNNKPLLVSHQVINDYAEINVDTLHKKNLLHLGEDRYLTTLILKHFPNYKTKFTPDAACLTNAPDRWPVLLSQRRRWINSTVHNLGELIFLPQLCGFCCFSMRFVVMLDLLSTLVMPAVVCYLVYLIYQLSVSTSQVPLISIITLAGVYGLQAIIFILRRKWEHIGWMIVYILAIPVFSFLVPLYAFWHFDDFSWGNTRIVVGEKGQKKVVGPEEGTFDPSTIPLRRWAEYEANMYDDGWEKGSYSSRRHLMDTRSIYSNNSARPMSPLWQNGRAGSTLERRMIPTEPEIAREIERILDENDLMHLTKKQVRDALSDIFGIDMTYKRDYINQCIERSLRERIR